MTAVCMINIDTAFLDFPVLMISINDIGIKITGTPMTSSKSAISRDPRACLGAAITQAGCSCVSSGQVLPRDDASSSLISSYI